MSTGSDSTELPDPASFLSGQTGHVAGRRAVGRRVGDRLLDLRLAFAAARLDEIAAAAPERTILGIGAYRPGSDRIARAVEELRVTRHRLRLALGSAGDAAPELEEWTVAANLAGGKFENLRSVIDAAGGVGSADWVIVVDDDVVLPPLFLDRFIGLCEAAELGLAQPAQTLASHAAWTVVRRRAGPLLRISRFVEIGPVTAFRADVMAALLPFPELRYGWGLDLHWAALAEQRGWRLGIVDATPVRHDAQPVASSYPAAAAIDEARVFLAGRPYLTSDRVSEVSPWRP